jgi:hypothetical protein
VRIFVQWVLSQRYWLVLAAIVFSPLPVISSALMVLNTLQRGPREGLLTALATSGALALLAVATGGQWREVAIVGGAMMLAGSLIGGAVRWGGLLVLGFQGTVLASALIAAGITLLGPEPEVLSQMLAERFKELMWGDTATLEQIALIDSWRPLLPGITFAATFAQLVGALLLGYWAFGIARAEAHFGPEFRTLRLGRFLGIPAIIIVGIGFVVATPLVQDLAPIALFAFLFQGIAVMHAWVHARRWNAAWLWPVYILLVTPWAVIPFGGLSAIGLLDNIFALRPRLES